MTEASGKSGAALAPENIDERLELYRMMVQIRQFEERVAELFRAGELPGFVHLSVGQEAVAAGVIGALRESDYITATHRGHGQIIAKGAELGPMFAELMGKATGYCHGKGGSMHIFDMRLGVLGATPILGAAQPIAVGAAYSARLQGRDDVAITFFGEGASAQGAVHEAMNLAGVWAAPVIFVAEVNGFAELTPYSVHVSVDSLAERGAAYGMPGHTVDGSDVLAVYSAAAELIDRARGGEGPSLLEIRTLRWRGHYEGDPQKYRDPAELEQRTEFDPVARLATALLTEGVEQQRLDEIGDEAAQKLSEALAWARDQPLPEPRELLDDVYIDEALAEGI